MATSRSIAVIVVLATLAGCGNDGLVKLTGQLLENGQTVNLSTGESVQIDFVTADGAYPPLNLGVYARTDGHFAADMNDGTGRGLPPGKYKVKFNSEGTTLKKTVHPKLFKESHTVEVRADANLHLTVDLASGTFVP